MMMRVTENTELPDRDGREDTGYRIAVKTLPV
jgi:hypothetical protein